MASEAKREYGAQLRLRKAGKPSELGGDASFIEAKPHFYADARLLIDRVRETYADYRRQHPPYGLVDRSGKPFQGFMAKRRTPWMQLEALMVSTAGKAFEATIPSETGCPYHPALKNLGAISLRPEVVQSADKERLREIVFPGAGFAPATIVNILSRMPAMAAANQATIGNEELARNSAHALLQEPLHHPQQHAKAFTFCLADGFGGQDDALDRSSFMSSDVIADYTQLGHDIMGREVIQWSRPTSDFVLRAAVRVANRLEGPESDPSGDHITIYPAGTRLGDIAVDEPTIGCPGSQLAYEMWDQAVDVIVGEGLWEN